MSKLMIFLNGNIGSGKNEVASYLSSRYGFSQYAFGEKIREGLYALNPYLKVDGFIRGSTVREEVNALGWDRAKREIPEIRRLLQVFGTEAGREIHGENAWAKLVNATMNPCNDSRPAVVSDLRFPSEFEYFKGRYSAWSKFLLQIIHITKPDVTNQEVHVSESMDVEAEFPGYVRELSNDGNIKDLHAKVDAILFQLVFNQIVAK